MELKFVDAATVGVGAPVLLIVPYGIEICYFFLRKNHSLNF